VFGEAATNLIPCAAMSKEFRTWKIDEAHFFQL